LLLLLLLLVWQKRLGLLYILWMGLRLVLICLVCSNDLRVLRERLSLLLALKADADTDYDAEDQEDYRNGDANDGPNSKLHGFLACFHVYGAYASNLCCGYGG